MKSTIHNLASGNRIGLMLFCIILLILSYPISELGPVAGLLFIGVYLMLTGSSVYLVSDSPRLLTSMIVLVVAIAVTGGITVGSNFTAPIWIQLLWNLSVFLQLIVILVLLTTFIIQSEIVNQDVIFAAIIIYFLLAAFFTLLYVVIETLAPGAFVSSSGADITWQRMTYFSLVTISTLGYGDIVPVSSVAQSFSALEASVGTLYIAILIGRFVSLYQNVPTPHSSTMTTE